jgi:hypothetical protein
LTRHEADLAVADKNIARVREEYEARDRVLNENSRAQQDSLKDARGHHQTVEEKKNPAYLNIGRHLASQGIAPPNAPHLLREVQKHRVGVERHMQHTAELAVLSSQIDKPRTPKVLLQRSFALGSSRHYCSARFSIAFQEGMAAIRNRGNSFG